MTRTPDDSDNPKRPRDGRQDRLGAALRANLQRRKAQARARQAENQPPQEGQDRLSRDED